MKRILVVEDSKTVRNLVAFIMKREGFDVCTADDGQDGVDAISAAEDRFDLIITDIEMPRMDGFELIKTIREQAAYQNTPIIVLSSLDEEQFVNKGRALGANLYMVKPAQPNKLVTNAKQLLG